MEKRTGGSYSAIVAAKATAMRTKLAAAGIRILGFRFVAFNDEFLKLVGQPP
jgi:hypothetical protein